MHRHRHPILAVASLSLGLLLAAAPAHAASLTQVNRSTWAGSASLPSYVQMYIYVPDKLATKPPIMVSAHSCGSTATGQIGNIPKIKAAADQNGFILILPDNPGQNCWDVGSSKSLKHDGGGDTQAVAEMVKYAITKYSADASRIYIMGGSSGGMMTQAMLAVYPDLFKAGSARAGVPAGCWADGYSSSNQWSGNCAAGNTTKTAQQWGDLVRSMYPGYTGHRPRVQLIQGGSDTTISSKNMGESIKEWTNVLGLSTDPTSKDTGFKGEAASYDRQFWKNDCGFTVLESWVAPGKDHSMAYEETAIMAFFGLDKAVGGPDPEDAACSADAGTPGAGGASGSGGTSGAGGASGSGGIGGQSDAGMVARDAGRDTGTPGTGGEQASGGSPGAGGAGGDGSGGDSGKGGASAKGGSEGSGGVMSSGGTRNGSGGQGSGGTMASGGTSAQGGQSGTGGSSSTANNDSGSNGCSCALGHRSSSLGGSALLLLAALLMAHRRRRTR
jgi:acetylxylan esterase